MAIDPDEAYVENSRAPLLDHLKELRTRLTICIVALLGGFFLSFVFVNQILEFLLKPWRVAEGMMELQRQQGHNHPFNLDMISGVLGFTQLPAPSGKTVLEVISTAPLETFLVKVKLAAFGAVVICFPVIAWQLYRFVAPGLYRKERMAFAPFLIASPALFIMGAAMVYYLMLPFVLWFSLNQQVLGDITIKMTPRVAEHLSISTKLILAFGLCFQLPVVLSLLGLAGLITSKQLRSFWRYAVVLIFLVAAICTPPDPISQLSLAIPLVLLYEISIWCVKLMEFRRRKADEAADAATSVS